MPDESDPEKMIKGGVEIYAILRSSIRDLQDDRNFQTQRFQNLAIALGAGYGFISVGVDASERPIFVAVGLLSVNIGVLVVAFLWRIQVKIFADAFQARYTALHQTAETLRLPINPFALDLKERKKLLERKPSLGPRTTSELQKTLPVVYALFLAVMSAMTAVQIWALDFSTSMQ